MAKLQEQWINESDLELVSFSIDPERDTLRVLSQYAGRFKADAKRWLFLTGGKRMRAWSSRLKKHLHIALSAVRANM
jgi:cytochrome oxidase Cu insertion factor (SCO1/SenC/PrrC family)